MRKTLGTVAASTVAGAALIAASALPGSAAPHEAESRTLHFVLHSTAGQGAGPRTFIGADRATQHGKVVGFDSYSGVVHQKQKYARLDVSLALKDGLITARVHLNFNQHSTFTGTVLGGTRHYADASGTVHGYSPTQQSSTTFLTINLR